MLNKCTIDHRCHSSRYIKTVPACNIDCLISEMSLHLKILYLLLGSYVADFSCTVNIQFQLAWNQTHKILMILTFKSKTIHLNLTCLCFILRETRIWLKLLFKVEGFFSTCTEWRDLTTYDTKGELILDNLSNLTVWHQSSLSFVEIKWNLKMLQSLIY